MGLPAHRDVTPGVLHLFFKPALLGGRRAEIPACAKNVTQMGCKHACMYEERMLMHNNTSEQLSATEKVSHLLKSSPHSPIATQRGCCARLRSSGMVCSLQDFASCGWTPAVKNRGCSELLQISAALRMDFKELPVMTMAVTPAFCALWMTACRSYNSINRDHKTCAYRHISFEEQGACLENSYLIKGRIGQVGSYVYQREIFLPVIIYQCLGQITLI